MSRSPTSLQIGDRVEGRFEVRRRIGAGDFGEVFEVVVVESGRPAAMKLFVASEVSALVLAQVERLAARAHGIDPTFVAPLATGAVDSATFLVTDLAVAPSLSTSAASRPLGLPLVARWVTELARALDAVHAAGLAHGDLAPANVFADVAGGPLRVTDFGLATLRGLLPDRQSSAVAPFIAPEQSESGLASATGDVFSLACLAFFALTGTSYFRRGRSDAFDADALREEQRAVEPDVGVRAAERGVLLPDAVAEAIGAGLAPFPLQRPASASELARALQQGVAAAPALSQRPRSARARRPRFDGMMIMDDETAALVRNMVGGDPKPSGASKSPQPADNAPAVAPPTGTAPAPLQTSTSAPARTVDPVRAQFERTHTSAVAPVFPDRAPGPSAAERPAADEPPPVGSPPPDGPPVAAPAALVHEPPPVATPPVNDRSGSVPSPTSEPPLVGGARVSAPALVSHAPVSEPPPVETAAVVEPPSVQEPPLASAPAAVESPAPSVQPAPTRPAPKHSTDARADEPAVEAPAAAAPTPKAPPAPEPAAFAPRSTVPRSGRPRLVRPFVDEDSPRSAAPRNSGSAALQGAPAFEMPRHVDDRPPAALRSEPSLFSRRQVFWAFLAVLAVFALGAAGLWELLGLGEPVDFPSEVPPGAP